MNGAHWHLFLSHLPIVIPMVGLLVMVGGVLFKSDVLKRAAYSIFILGALKAIVSQNCSACFLFSLLFLCAYSS